MCIAAIFEILITKFLNDAARNDIDTATVICKKADICLDGFSFKVQT